jgi:flagellar basal-body rod protein FlgB|uniref:Flagellar basal body rod protein FlgB n=1 Tax=Desulfobacca acetoxidans TaxID=60893 RepID=A0A7C5EL02_9BACT
MSSELFADGTLQLLEKSLTWRSVGQETIASNLANLETPGYTSQEVNFAKVLKDHLQGRPGIRLALTNPRHLPGAGSKAGLVQDTHEPPDLDREMVNLSLNQLGYHTSVAMLIKKLEQLRSVMEAQK